MPTASTSPIRNGWRDWLVVGLLVLLQLLLWKLRVHDAASIEVIELGVIDHYVEHHPMMLLMARRLLAGALPLWNPFELCGVPFLASPQVGLFYVPNLLFVLLDPAIAEEVALVLHLSFAAACTYGFVRTWGVPRAAGVAAALVFVWCGRMNTIVNQYSALVVLCWLPATLWLVERAVRGRRYALPGLALAVCLQLFAGSPETTLMNLQVAGLYTVLRLAPELFGGSVLPGLRRALGLLVAVLIGAALAAPQLLPTLELVAQSDRIAHTVSLEEATKVGTIPPGELLGMLVSDRSTLPDYLQWAHVRSGFLALLAIALGLGVSRLRPLYVFGVLLVALAVAMTQGGALFELYFATPLGENFRRPWKWLALLGFGAALLSAVGVTQLAEWARQSAVEVRRSRVLPLTLLLGLVLVLSSGVGWASAATLVGLAGFVVLPGSAARRGLVLGLVGVSALQLFLGFENRHLRIARRPELLHERAELWRELGERAGERRILTSAWLLRRPALTAKQGDIRGVALTAGYDPLASYRHAVFFDAAGAVPFESRRFYGSSSLPRTLDPAVFDRSATGLYLLDRNEPLARSLERRRGGPLGSGFTRVQLPLPEHLVLYERGAALPRARFVADVVPVDDLVAARRALTEARGAQRPILEPANGRPAEVLDRGASGTARIRTLEPERVEIDVSATGPGFVVLADAFYPGWQARVDGSAVPIHAADVLFRAVPVPAGDSRVVFEYRPDSVRQGLAVGGLAGLLLVGVVVAEWRRGRAPSLG